MRSRTRRAVATTVVLALLAAGVPLGSPQAANAVSANLVISQVYGGGGNTGAPYTHDFIELFNRGSAPASLNGMSLQYASATGTGNLGANSGQLTELPNVSLAAGQYYLVQQAAGAGNGVALPTADLVDPTPIAMAAGAGKVALVTGTSSLGCNGGSAPCDATALARIVDLVGYGNANFFEGSGAAPALFSTTAGLRAGGGCTDTDNNAADFSSGAPAPRNSATALAPCGADAAPSVSSTSPVDEAVAVAVNSNISVTFSEAVVVAVSWFSIACDTSGSHSATTTGGPTTFTLDPDTDFAELEECTVTIVAAQVTDQDTDDPPDNMAANYVFTFTTEGDACAQPYTAIYSIQGSGMSAAITGNVTTQGVVVGDFEGSSGLSGFYLQDETGDDNPATSDGIFVFTGSADLVSAGQVVRVTGFARERSNQTAINGSNSNSSAVTNIIDCATTGSVAPVDVAMPFESTTHLERYEGMLVRFPQSLVISEYFNYDRFGEIVIGLPLEGESRHFTPSLLVEPGPDAAARASAYNLRRITLDDGLSAQNPAFTRHPNGDAFSLTNRFRGGDTLQNVVGVVGFDFGLYRIQPTGPADYTALNARPTAPANVGGTLKVAVMNTLNFFITADYPPGNPLDNKCGPSNAVECRGWDFNQPNEFTRQRDKLLAALVGLNADVIGLNELENTTGVDPLGDPNGIVAGLNGILGGGTFDYIDTGVIGPDTIRVGMIYRPAKVSPVGSWQILTSAIDPRFNENRSRPALAQTFSEVGTGERFTVVVNHLKSKGSGCGAGDDDPSPGGAASCNLTRTLAARAIVDWLATDPTGSGDPDFLIMGDLNAYAMEDPIKAVQAGADDTLGTADDYTNLISDYMGAYAYSYVFNGQAGYLDHALANHSMRGQVTGATEWHINSDEADLLDYDTSFKPPAQAALYESNAYRSSDHDPLVVGLRLGRSSSQATGKGTAGGASFEFVVSQRTASPPTGNTTVVLPNGQTFRSTSYHWLQADGTTAMYAGAGQLNGVGGYSFLVSMVDGGSPGSKDRIRVRIWQTGGAVVFDTQSSDPAAAAPTRPLTSGNLVVHKPR